MIKLLDVKEDKVINSINIAAVADYTFALDKLVPLIDKLDFQRNPLRKSFYKRLEDDIVKGCIMPFLTIALIDEVDNKKIPYYSDVNTITSIIDQAFVLDGIQRLNTLKRASQRPELEKDRPIYFNILVCHSMDKLLYRMVTLNNGQKPMSARHQIEILADKILSFDELPIASLTEKQSKSRTKPLNDDYLSKEDLIKAYLAYITNSINIDNQKIIEDKMDELITDQIMDSNITDRDSQYYDVIAFVKKCFTNEFVKTWLKITNNFIGFSAAMSVNFEMIKSVSPDFLEESLKLFEKAFSFLNPSKIKLGLTRRKLVKFFFENYQGLSTLDENELLDKISMEL